jgi:D-alanyl-D-alanine carboxypeptidase
MNLCIVKHRKMMQIHWRTFGLYGIVVILLLMACQKSTVEPQKEEDSKTLYLSPTYVQLNEQGEAKKITVFSPQQWELELSDDWIMATPQKGGDWASVEISAKANEGFEAREGKIRFKSGKQVVELVVTQRAHMFASVDKHVHEFMEMYQIPSASLAITYKERLVYLKAYGIADKQRNEPATDKSVYRTASISKVITLTAALKLVEEGLLRTNEKVFGPNSVLGYDLSSTFADPRVLDMTVEHLMQHTAGWKEAPGNANADIPVYIRQVLSQVPLGYAPGTTHYYSNFGYLLLGKVIEKRADMDYETYVKTKLLAPIGIHDMHIGGNTPADRKPNEVTYYQEGIRVEYVNVWQSFSNGGWVASAKSLAKFLVHIDRNPDKYADLLPPGLMLPYLIGWGSWTHDGGCPGTATRASHLNDDINFALLFNAGVPFEHLKMGEILLKQQEWPATLDLFDAHFPQTSTP